MRIRENDALTFDDVLLVPRHSLTHPKDVSTVSRFTTGITLNVPLIAAAMDTVTESEMAIAMARAGGIGVVHKNMSIDRQAAEIDRVKRSESVQVARPERPEDEPIGCQRRPHHDVSVREPCALERRVWDGIISRHGRAEPGHPRSGFERDWAC